MFDLRLESTTLDFRVSHRRAHPPATANDPPVNFRLKITGPGEGLLEQKGAENESIRVLRDR